MPIEFNCSQCSNLLRVPDDCAGRQAKCPSCGTITTIPGGPAPEGGSIDESGANIDPGSGATWSAPEATAPFSNPVPPYGAAGAPDYSKPMNSPFASPVATGVGGYQEAHRGGLILTLGIFAILCNFMAVPGILAWVLGSSDLKKMEAGLMDRSGEGTTRAGMIMGIIGTSLVVLGMAFYCVFFMIAMAAGAGGVNM